MKYKNIEIDKIDVTIKEMINKYDALVAAKKALQSAVTDYEGGCYDFMESFAHEYRDDTIRSDYQLPEGFAISDGGVLECGKYIIEIHEDFYDMRPHEAVTITQKPTVVKFT